MYRLLIAKPVGEEGKNGRAEGSKSTPEAADDEAQRYGSGILLLGSGPLATNY
jgi:hypothetical protein